MHPLLSKTAIALAVTALAQGVAQAALFDVDKGPYLPANGNFASWYQDTHGRTLDLCLSKAVSSRVAGAPGAPAYMCLLNPSPGIFDDTKNIVFPGNFPDEAFWFTGDGSITDAATGINLTYTSALEAAFSGGDPVEGDQISFARIRIRVDVPVKGTYIITHPYGVDVFDVETPGRRAINMTRDIGIGAPKTYEGALKGEVGPFLRSIRGPYTETDPITHAATQFVGDPNLEEAFTGSPFNTNYIRVEGPGGIDVRTTTMAISGKLSTLTRPSPIIAERSTYSRKMVNGNPVAQQDVFAMAPPPPATVTLDSNSPVLNLTEADTTGHWYAQSPTNPASLSPVLLTSDNHLAIPTSTPTTVPSQLTDLVVITSAVYKAGHIDVQASSSDETSPPTLTVTTDTGQNIGTIGSDGTMGMDIGLIPPARIRVTSSNGGSDTEEVVIVQ